MCKSLSIMPAVMTEQFNRYTQQMGMLLELQHLRLHTKQMESFVLAEHYLNCISLVPAHSETSIKDSLGLVFTLNEAAFHIWFNTSEKMRG